MSATQKPLTYEGILKLIEGIAQSQRETDQQIKETRKIIQENAQSQRETDRQIKETDQRLDRIFQESAEQIKKTNHEIGKLGSRVGEIVENMVGGGNIIAQFRALGHHVIAYSRDKNFGERGTDASGQIDLFLEDGDIAILVEVKTNLKNDHVEEHVERMEKYRQWINARGGDKKRYIGAVAGAVVADNVASFAQKKGFYVIVQTGDIFEIIKPPERFKAREW